MTLRAKQLKSYIGAAKPRFEEMLAELVETPSVSADPQYAGDVRRSATLASQFFKHLGADARIIKTAGYPVVSGGWTIDSHFPTVTIYNHLDVQPAQEPQWHHPPFSFRKKSGVYYGRGTTDDKGPAITALLAAQYAAETGIPINVRFLWECEEEIGSPNFGDAFKQKGLIPKPDSVLVSDTIWISRTRPAIPYGLRGMLGARLCLQTGRTDVHSGVTGGAARNPLAELCAVAAACADAHTGRVHIPGFYNTVIPPSRSELQGFLASGFRVAHFKKTHGLRMLRTEDPTDLLKRIWAWPTFEVHGLVGGYTGPGIKTVVPGQAELKVSMRLVPDQKPEDILKLLRDFVAKINPSVRVEGEGMLHPYKSSITDRYADAVREAVRDGFGKDPVFIREGGSIGAVPRLAKQWNVPIVFLGLSLPEHGYHAPNEQFDWGQAAGGIRAFVSYFSRLSNVP